MRIRHWTGRLIEELREEQNMTQVELSYRADVHVHTIKDLETGNNANHGTIKTIEKVFDALGYEFDVHDKGGDGNPRR